MNTGCATLEADFLLNFARLFNGWSLSLQFSIQMHNENSNADIITILLTFVEFLWLATLVCLQISHSTFATSQFRTQDKRVTHHCC